MNDPVREERITTLAHELRSPLNAILGWTRLLRSGRVPAGDRPRALATIEHNAAALALRLEQYLETARLSSGKVELLKTRVDVADIAGSVVYALRPLAESHRITFSLAIEDPDCTVQGDGARLRQVIENLLSNALKFTPPGGRVTASLARRGERVILSVSDNGDGIAHEALPHLFERFWQGRPPTGTHEARGLGLGLSIVRELVELHGGAVHAESAGCGMGATFVVSLPTCDQGNTPSPDEASSRPSHVRIRPGRADARSEADVWQDHDPRPALPGPIR